MTLARVQQSLPTAIFAWGFAFAAAAFLGWILATTLPTDPFMDGPATSILVATSLFFFLGTVIHLLLARPSSDLVRPRVILYINADNAESILLFSPADWLSYRSVYAIFVKEENSFERFIGLGQVYVIQDDKRIQVVVTQKLESAKHVWENLVSGSRDYFDKIVLKPGVPSNG